ncbi:MAG: thiolase family protein, partial [Acidimicrobiales bacterium]|nr:thiolase family protein [Acidimicrobiales bacterium]
MDVAIVGIGIHPFGRHEGVSGMAQGVFAARQALADAGIGWGDVQCAFGGSAVAGNPETMVSQLGLTGIPFVNVHNGCATGGSALAMADRAVRSGDFDLAMA